MALKQWTSTLENKLNTLTEGYEEAARIRAALDWKKGGGKVIGLLGCDVPEEIIYASGMLPWRIIGTRGADLSLARVYRPDPGHCYYCNHVLQSE